MKFFTAFALSAVLCSSTLAAGASRLEVLSDRLARTAEIMASESYRGFADRDRGNRADVEALYLVQQFSAGAALFRQMVLDGRPDSELRDASDILSVQMRNADRYGFGRKYWQDIRTMMDEVGRELNTPRYRGGIDEIQNRVVGRMSWRGAVDDLAQIYVKAAGAAPRILSGAPVRNAQFNFTAPLPQRPVMVQVRKLRGRGSVDVIQQPSRDNGFTAVVEIRDQKGGADDYEFELIW